MEGSQAQVIEFVGVSKRYVLFNRRRERAKALLGLSRGLSFKTAIDNVSFQVRAGETVGLIGQNGSGKSTLLRLVAGASFPDAGMVNVAGPVGAILELGLGFHPDFTGRENALIYGSLVGLPEARMRDRLPEILDFAELGDYIDQPLRTYSSGMAARLAFAVAAHVNPRILVVDEVLAVGDSAFQKKCIDRIIEIKDQGCTILFCSHSLYLVTSFCRRAIWLRAGRIVADGDAKEVADAYQSEVVQASAPEGKRSQPRDAIGGMALLKHVEILNSDGGKGRELRSHENVTMVFTVEAVRPGVACHVGLAVDSKEGRCVLVTSTHRAGLPPVVVDDRVEVHLELPNLPLAGGRFRVYCYLLDDSGLHIYDQIIQEDGLVIATEEWTPALVEVAHRWVVRR